MLKSVRAVHFLELLSSLKAFLVQLIQGANGICWFRHDTEIDFSKMLELDTRIMAYLLTVNSCSVTRSQSTKSKTLIQLWRYVPFAVLICGSKNS
jgi:hypothetical protein